MLCSPTLTSEEFKQIHNGLCDLHRAISQLEDILSPDVLKLLRQSHHQIHTALNGAHDQEDRVFERNRKHYESVQKELRLDAIWSMFEIDDLNKPHPFEGVVKVVYRDHWRKNPVSCAILGNTWAALYMAANSCIRDSGDNHHVFIENFTKEDDVLILSTGS